MCSVDASIMFINCQTFANFVQILFMLATCKTLPIFYAKKTQNCLKSRKKVLYVSLKVIVYFNIGSPVTTSVWVELQFTSICHNGALK